MDCGFSLLVDRTDNLPQEAGGASVVCIPAKPFDWQTVLVASFSYNCSKLVFLELAHPKISEPLVINSILQEAMRDTNVRINPPPNCPRPTQKKKHLFCPLFGQINS